jgi:hypothetical protein
MFDLECFSVACAIGPSVKLIPNKLFLSKPFFIIKLKFQWQKLFKIQYLSHIRSKNFQITFTKSYSMMAFQDYLERTQIPL